MRIFIYGYCSKGDAKIIKYRMFLWIHTLCRWGIGTLFQCVLTKHVCVLYYDRIGFFIYNLVTAWNIFHDVNEGNTDINDLRKQSCFIDSSLFGNKLVLSTVLFRNIQFWQSMPRQQAQGVGRFLWFHGKDGPQSTFAIATLFAIQCASDISRSLFSK